MIARVRLDRSCQQIVPVAKPGAAQSEPALQGHVQDQEQAVECYCAVQGEPAQSHVSASCKLDASHRFTHSNWQDMTLSAEAEDGRSSSGTQTAHDNTAVQS